MRGEASAEARTAAAAAFQHACSGISAASVAGAAQPDVAASDHQRSPQGAEDTGVPPAHALVRAAAWPLPVSAGDLARDSLTATLALDAAVLETCFAQALAAQLAAAGLKDHPRAEPQRPPSAAQLAILPAPALAQALTAGAGPLGEGLQASRTGLDAQDEGESECWLRLAWAAATCLAERATAADAAARVQWVAAFAAQQQVPARRSCCSGVGLVHLTCFNLLDCGLLQ